MNPSISHFETLFASLGVRLDWFDLIEMLASGHRWFLLETSFTPTMMDYLGCGERLPGYRYFSQTVGRSIHTLFSRRITLPEQDCFHKDRRAIRSRGSAIRGGGTARDK
jgi:hypothetical protein